MVEHSRFKGYFVDNSARLARIARALHVIHVQKEYLEGREGSGGAEAGSDGGDGEEEGKGYIEKKSERNRLRNNESERNRLSLQNMFDDSASTSASSYVVSQRKGSKELSGMVAPCIFGRTRLQWQIARYLIWPKGVSLESLTH